MRAMTPEERFERIERTLEFLAASQAELAASVAKNSDSQAELTASVQRHDAQIAENSKNISQLSKLFLRTLRVIKEQGRQTDERIKAIAEAQSLLMITFERHLAEGRN